MLKPRNRRDDFETQNHQTVDAGFEVQTRKSSTTLILKLNQEVVATDFEAKVKKTVPVVLMPNH
jgi:hypothetical protein